MRVPEGARRDLPRRLAPAGSGLAARGAAPVRALRAPEAGLRARSLRVLLDALPQPRRARDRGRRVRDAGPPLDLRDLLRGLQADVRLDPRDVTGPPPHPTLTSERRPCQRC